MPKRSDQQKGIVARSEIDRVAREIRALWDFQEEADLAVGVARKTGRDQNTEERLRIDAIEQAATEAFRRRYCREDLLLTLEPRDHDDIADLITLALSRLDEIEGITHPADEGRERAIRWALRACLRVLAESGSPGRLPSGYGGSGKPWDDLLMEARKITRPLTTAGVVAATMGATPNV